MLIPIDILVYVSIGLNIILLGWVLYLQLKISNFLKGKDAKSLEDLIVFSNKEIADIREFEKDSIEYFKDIERRLKKSIQSVETIRFNPFKGTGEGGNQSFSTSFVNENGNGVVISSLYSRDRISVFSKPIIKWDSPFELTEEEKDVLKKSKENL